MPVPRLVENNLKNRGFHGRRSRRSAGECPTHAHSGWGNVELVDIDDGVVKLRLVGSCVSCSSSLMTLKMGIEKALKKAIPMVRCVEAVE